MKTPLRGSEAVLMPLQGQAKEAKAMWLERSESQRLETLAGVPWAYSPRANHPLEGWS